MSFADESDSCPHHMFPILSASFDVSEDRLTVTVHVEKDKCN